MRTDIAWEMPDSDVVRYRTVHDLIELPLAPWAGAAADDVNATCYGDVGPGASPVPASPSSAPDAGRRRQQRPADRSVASPALPSISGGPATPVSDRSVASPALPSISVASPALPSISGGPAMPVSDRSVASPALPSISGGPATLASDSRGSSTLLSALASAVHAVTRAAAPLYGRLPLLMSRAQRRAGIVGDAPAPTAAPYDPGGGSDAGTDVEALQSCRQATDQRPVLPPLGFDAPVTSLYMPPYIFRANSANLTGAAVEARAQLLKKLRVDAATQSRGSGVVDDLPLFVTRTVREVLFGYADPLMAFIHDHVADVPDRCVVAAHAVRPC